MKSLKRFKRFSLILGPLVALVMVLNFMGTMSLSGFATGAPASAACPLDASAIKSWSVKITRNGSPINATNFSGVAQGDKVKVTFTVDDRCANMSVPIALVSYKSPSANYNANTVSQRVVYSQSQSGAFGASGGWLQVDVPNCYFSAGFVYGSVIVNMSPTNLYGSRKIDWKDGGTASCSNTAPAATQGTSGTTATWTCPSGTAAVAWYNFRVKRAGQIIELGTSLANVQSGDELWADFGLKPGCTNQTFSFASYETAEPYWNVNTATLQRYKAAANDTDAFSYNNGATNTLHTIIPACYFQTDFVRGPVIVHLAPDNLYGNAKIAWKNGGSPACNWNPQTQEQTPTATATTTTTGGTPTNTPPPTPTAVPPTPTPIPPGTLRLHFRADSETGPALPGGVAEITLLNGTKVNVQDGGAGDLPKIADGEISLPNLTPGTYFGVQTVAPGIYLVSGLTRQADVPPGGFGDITFVAVLPPGALQIHIRDSAGAALGDACVSVAAASGLSTTVVCDNDATAIDQDNRVGEMRLNGLVAGGYLGTQTQAKTGYDKDNAAKSALVPAGEVAEMTFVNTRPGNLNIRLEDNNGRALTGGCFQISGTSAPAAPVCVGPDGTARLTGLVPGTYSGNQTQFPSGYVGVKTSDSSIVPEGGAGSLVFVNKLPLGDLLIHKVDDSTPANPVAGACFDGWGPVDFEVCDDAPGFEDPTGVDANPAPGEILILGLVPGNYTVRESGVPDGWTRIEIDIPVTVEADKVAEITVVNPVDVASPPDTTTVIIHKLNCEVAQPSINPVDVANGILPAGCSVAPNVTFDIAEFPVYTGITTDANGRLIIHVAQGVPSITLIEHSATNPLAEQVEQDFNFHLDGLYCSCGHVDKVVVNLIPATSGQGGTTAPATTNAPSGGEPPATAPATGDQGGGVPPAADPTAQAGTEPPADPTAPAGGEQPPVASPTP